MIKDLETEGKRGGLELNYKKSKILSNKNNKNVKSIKIIEQEMDIVEETIYLGQLITFEDKTEKEVERRISLGWKKF